MAPKMIREVSAALGFTPGSTICATGRDCLDGRHKKSCARKIKHAYRSGRTCGQRAPRDRSQKYFRDSVPPSTAKARGCLCGGPTANAALATHQAKLRQSLGMLRNAQNAFAEGERAPSVAPWAWTACAHQPSRK